MLSAPLTDLAAAPTAAQFGLLLVYLAVLWLPGMAIGVLAGLRGWALLALGPLLTYGLASCAAPWMSRLDVRWTPGTVGLLLLGVLALAALLRWPLWRWTAATPWSGRREPLPAWTVTGQVAVGLAVLGAAVFGGTVLLTAFGGMSGVPQDWDAMLHANGVRYIAENGAGGVYQIYDVNTYAGDARLYYPNAYHLLAALVFELTGAGIPEVLNALSILLPLMLALALVALIRSFHGRVALAVFAALVSPMATAMPYDLLWRGPLLPFAAGLVLTFAALVALRLYLDRPSVLSAVPLILSGAGLLGLHPSTLLTVVLFGMPMLAQRWWNRPRKAGPELAMVIAPAAAGSALVIPHLAGSLAAAESVAGFTWPQTLTPAQAFGEIFAFSTSQPFPQVWLLVFLIAGLIGFRSLGQLRWMPVAASVLAILFVLSAACDTAWAQTLTSIWWNDKWRIAAIATMALLPIVAHGLTRTYDQILARIVLPTIRGIKGKGVVHPMWAGAATFVVLFVVFFQVADGGYAQRNIERTATDYGPGRTVSSAELEAFEVLDRLVQPGERVMNDRFDGSGWMYAMVGVHPVAAHFGAAGIGDGPQLLAREFDRYDTSLAVRAAVERLNVHWVMVGPGFVRSWKERQPGLDELWRVDALELVYDEAGVRIYELGSPALTNSYEPPPVTSSGNADE
ncbi:MAG: hypothetical protein GEU83_08895 [Pseudonocardiaceae bacterium]|nr:hypothetical protein [Pseudonocardiaceae bacterium]